MKRFVVENSLSLFFGTILILALAGQALTGLAEFNQQQLAAGLQQESLGGYLLSSDFAVDVAENWQSEFLQFLLYIYATVWLLQRGSSESKELDRAALSRTRTRRSGRTPPSGLLPGHVQAAGDWASTPGRWS
nr:DUF6766 family protein [Microlunatus sp. Gsoil 973]